jgi:peptide/nickel transport system permease protein
VTVSTLQPAEPEGAAAPRAERGSGRFLRRFRRQHLALVALVYLVLLGLVAVLAPWIAPYDPNAQDLSVTLLPIGSPEHLLGTDHYGRDELSRLMFATGTALLATGQAVLTGLVLGVVPGLVAGFLGGWVDAVIMRINDAMMSFPPLILAIAIVGVLGTGLQNAMIAIGIVFAPTFLRIVRGSVLEIRTETFIEASRTIGTPMSWVLRRHVVPNIIPPLLVQTSLAGAFALLSEAGLSFLGLGVQAPDASWGVMLSNGYPYLAQAPSLVVLPGVAVAVTVLAFNLLGDGLRDSIGREVRGR